MAASADRFLVKRVCAFGSCACGVIGGRVCRGAFVWSGAVLRRSVIGGRDGGFAATGVGKAAVCIGGVRCWWGEDSIAGDCIGQQVGEVAFRAVGMHRGHAEGHGSADEIRPAGERSGCRVGCFAKQGVIQVDAIAGKGGLVGGRLPVEGEQVAARANRLLGWGGGDAGANGKRERSGMRAFRAVAVSGGHSEIGGVGGERHRADQ